MMKSRVGMELQNAAHRLEGSAKDIRTPISTQRRDALEAAEPQPRRSADALVRAFVPHGALCSRFVAQEFADEGVRAPSQSEKSSQGSRMLDYPRHPRNPRL